MATAGRQRGTHVARPSLRPDDVRALKSGTAVEVEWSDGRTALYELAVDARGTILVSPESSRGRSEKNAPTRLWLPVALTLGDKIRLAG